MNNFFNLDNPVWQFIGKAFNACLLSIFYLIICIPIVTIGPATTALYYTFLKLVKDEESYLLREFFHSFKQNLKQSFIVWLILSILGTILIIDIFYFKYIPSTKGVIFYYIIFTIFLFYLAIYLYIFPLIAKFENTTKNMFKFAFLISIKHLGWTIIMVAIAIMLFLISLRIPPIILFLPGLTAFLQSYIFNYIFDMYIPKETIDNEINDENK